MNEILFYAGLVFAGFFLILSIFLFFYQKVPSAIRYFMKMGNKRVPSQGMKVVTSSGNAQKRSRKNVARATNYKQGGDNLQGSSSTELLDIAQNYATALLDADSTTLLPELTE